jgi:hypothetical protein
MPTHIRLPHNAPDTHDPFASPKQIALLERLIEEREMTEEQAAWYLSRVYRHKKHLTLITKADIRKWFGNREQGTGLFGRPLKPGYVPDRKAAFVQAPAGRTPTQDVGENSITVPPNVTAVPMPGDGHPFTDDGSDPGNCSTCHCVHPSTEVAPTPPPLRRTHSVAAEVGVYRHNDKVYVVRKRRGREYRYALVLVELGRPRLNEHGQQVTHDFVMAHGMQYELSADEKITDDEEIKALCIQVGHCVMCGHSIWQAKSVARMMGKRCYNRVHGLIR